MTAPDPRLKEIEDKVRRAEAYRYASVVGATADVAYLLAELRKAQDKLARVEGLADTWWANFPSKARAICAAVADATGGGE